MSGPRRRRGLPLSASFVSRVSEPGRYGDGRGGFGLYLRVYRRTNGRIARFWGQRVRINGRETNLGLGQFPVVTLAEARAKALANRRELEAGRDPRGDGIPTFADAADKVIRLHAKTWKDAETMARRWRQTLRTYAFPGLGRRRIDKITTADVLDVLTPIWTTKTATAKIVRQRIAAVMQWAMAKGFRTDNPAGKAVTAALPKRNGGTRHHRTIPHAELRDALAKVRDAKAAKATRLAYELATLTACRSGEVRGARWDEVDFDSATWTIPASRMKAKREHRVPLSRAALDVLARARNSTPYCFPGRKRQPITDVPLSRLARNNTSGTVHGLRTSFRVWCGDTGVAREVAEAALAHVVGGTEGAYARGTLFERRRAVMESWGEYVTG